MHKSKEFVLHGGDTAFANRQKLLFDQLSVAEKEYNKKKPNTDDANNEEMDIDVGDDKNKIQSHPRGIKRKSDMKRFRGKESIFKRPEGPAPRAVIRSIPDYHRNPHKWVKYSLEDVSNEDMSDKSNAQAAFSFLKEIKARKTKIKAHELKEKMDIEFDEDEEKGTIMFKSRKIPSSSKVEYKKPVTSKNKGESSHIIIADDDKPVFRSSKIIMPEYVVGQKQKKKDKKEKVVKIEKSKELKLDHLLELDDTET